LPQWRKSEEIFLIFPIIRFSGLVELRRKRQIERIEMILVMESHRAAGSKSA